MVWKAVKTLMQTSLLRVDKNILNHNGQKGFSLIEILVAISLVAIVFVALPISIYDTDREELEKSVKFLSRAVRSAVDESIMRNSLVRINISAADEGYEYCIEYGSGANLVLPEAVDESRMSISEREEYQKRTAKFNSQFNKTSDFLDSNEKLPETIMVYALGTSYQESLKKEPPFYIYFYPTGEKDAAVIYFVNEVEMATLEISAFENKTKESFTAFTDADLANLELSLENNTNEHFQKWLRNDL